MRINNNTNTQYIRSNAYKGNADLTSSPSFKGGVSDGLSKLYTNVASTKPYQNIIKNFSKSDKTFTHLLVMESCFLSGFYMLNTLRNKKIEKEQKPQMVINDALTLGVSTAGAYFAEDKITDVVMKGAEKYFTKHGDFYKNLGKEAQMTPTPKDELLQKVADAASKSGEELSKGVDDIVSTMGRQLKNVVGENGKLKAFQISPDKMETLKSSVETAVKDNAGKAEEAKNAVKGIVDDIYESSAAREQADKVLPGINKLKVLVIFGLIYRYLGPVVITPIANKISSKFFDKKNGEEDKQENLKTTEKK